MVLYALIERKMHHSVIILESYIVILKNCRTECVHTVARKGFLLVVCLSVMGKRFHNCRHFTLLLIFSWHTCQITKTICGLWEKTTTQWSVMRPEESNLSELCIIGCKWTVLPLVRLEYSKGLVGGQG